MKKQNLAPDDKDMAAKNIPKKLSWNKFRDMKLDDIRKIIAVYNKVIVYTNKGDIYELKEIEF